MIIVWEIRWEHNLIFIKFEFRETNSQKNGLWNSWSQISPQSGFVVYIESRELWGIAQEENGGKCKIFKTLFYHKILMIKESCLISGKFMFAISAIMNWCIKIFIMNEHWKIRVCHNDCCILDKKSAIVTSFNTAINWCYNEHDGVSNHQHLVYSTVCSGVDQSKPQSSMWPLVTGGFPSQRASNAENVSIWWRHIGQHERLWPTSMLLMRITVIDMMMMFLFQ